MKSADKNERNPHALDTFNLGHDADPSFMKRPAVGAFCKAARFPWARNWAGSAKKA